MQLFHRNKIIRYFLSVLLFLMVFSVTLSAQTIAEKKASLHQSEDGLAHSSKELLSTMNEKLLAKQQELQQLYIKVEDLHRKGAPEEAYKNILDRINVLKLALYQLEADWQKHASEENRGEEYALWHQPDTTLAQLVMDYGSQDYVYIIPPELGAMKLSVNSNVPIPRSSWSEMLNLILVQNGIGIKQLNPYLRQLIVLKQDLSSIQVVTSSRSDLDLMPIAQRICFVLEPKATDLRRVTGFLQKFAHPQHTTVQLIGGEIFIVASVESIQELLKLYDFAAAGRGEKDYKLVTLTRAKADEMCRVLTAIFQAQERRFIRGNAERSERPSNEEPDGGLKIIQLNSVAQALFLVGTEQELRKAEEIIREVEGGFGDIKDKTVFWYTCRHTDAEELAVVLERVYNLMIKTGAEMEEKVIVKDRFFAPSDPRVFPGNDIDLVVNPARVNPALNVREEPNELRKNFIVDPKTGSLVMVVDSVMLPKIKELIKRLDVPKKMVRIELLLFEKKFMDRTKFGLNLLRMGGAAKNVHNTSMKWNDQSSSDCGKGILEFVISRVKGDGIPAYDLAYNFLISQDDVQINANPSVTTINQTPATIALVEEISINTGASEVDGYNGSRLVDSYVRAQYGITVKITPNIHPRCAENDDDADFITLETDITFDTAHPDSDNRPNVTRRHITNEVRVANGETVILGGLRRKVQQDGKDAIPFLGEIPGVGKLFSTTDMMDSSTEMFICLTPTIIEDPCEELEAMRMGELKRRPGDTPEFMQQLIQAQDKEKQRRYSGGMKILLGRLGDKASSKQKTR